MLGNSGISSCVSGKPYQFTAETLDPCLISFVRSDDFVQFIKQHGDACLQAAEKLSNKHHAACRELRAYGLSYSAEKKLARLLLEWSAKNEESMSGEPRITFGLTQEEIAQMIGVTRETVVRLFAKMKKQQILSTKGSTVVIRDKAALIAIARD